MLFPISHTFVHSKVQNSKSIDCELKLYNYHDFKTETNLITNKEQNVVDNLIKRYECDICGQIFYKRFLIIEHFRISLCFPEISIYSKNNSTKYSWCNNSKNVTLHNSNISNLVHHNIKEAFDFKISSSKIQNNKLITNYQILISKKNNLKCNGYSKDTFKNKCCINRTYKWKCKACGASFDKFSILKAHQFIHFKNKQINYSTYNKLFINSNSLKNYNLVQKKVKIPEHINIIPNLTQNYECYKCSKVFHKRFEIISHIYNNHQEDYFKYSCDACSKLYHLQESIMHWNKNHFKCDVCPQSFSTLYRLHQHYRWHLGINCFKCQYCFKIFTRCSDYLFHEKTHTNEKPFRCNFCGEWFPISSNLNIYFKKPYECDICQKTFNHMMSLLSHRKIHKKKKKIKGTSCNELPSQSINLKIHTDSLKNRDIVCKRADNNKNFKCALCLKLISDANKFVAHRCTSFKCKFCLEIFCSTSSFKIHCEKIHQINKPFECGICKRIFMHSVSLNRHKKKHYKFENQLPPKLNNTDNKIYETNKSHTNKEFKCDLCKTTFYIQSQIITHILETHY